MLTRISIFPDFSLISIFFLSFPTSHFRPLSSLPRSYCHQSSPLRIHRGHQCSKTLPCHLPIFFAGAEWVRGRPILEMFKFELHLTCKTVDRRGKSGPALSGTDYGVPLTATEYRLMPSACRLVVRAKL